MTSTVLSGTRALGPAGTPAPSLRCAGLAPDGQGERLCTFRGQVFRYFLYNGYIVPELELETEKTQAWKGAFPKLKLKPHTAVACCGFYVKMNLWSMPVLLGLFISLQLSV